MSAINVNSITGRTGTHGPVLTGVTTVTGGTLNTAALNVTGAASFSGNVSIAGTLSYEDVTDIDSVGIITARSGIHLDDSIVHLGDTNTKIRFPAADTITAETAGSERLRVTSAGLVGIGTNNPVRKLDVDGTSRFTDYIYGNSTTNKIYVNDDLALSATKKLYFDTGSNTYIHEAAADQLAIVTGGTERLRITSGGEIGIGNNGSFGIFTGANDRNLLLGTGSGSNGIQLHCSTTGYGGIYFGDSSSGNARYSGYIEYKNNENFFRIATSETERLRITSGGDVNNLGNVGVQTTYPTSSTLVGAASSLIGLYIGDGHMLFSDNLSRSGGYYIPNGLNALNAGPVTLGSTMTLDGVWVIV
tara:strand:- start:32282 stop:33361 length:1080 start_codon:yes stop_codon:yes gene_type:complete